MEGAYLLALGLNCRLGQHFDASSRQVLCRAICMHVDGLVDIERERRRCAFGGVGCHARRGDRAGGERDAAEQKTAVSLANGVHGMAPITSWAAAANMALCPAVGPLLGRALYGFSSNPTRKLKSWLRGAALTALPSGRLPARESRAGRDGASARAVA